MVGTTISHYKILEKIGEGGMGEVYKAEDTRLKRIVALKFLSSHLSDSGEEKARFLREAQSASALNHPNISQIYEIDEFKGDLFIAMEFVEGQTLREKIRSAMLNPKSAIEFALQIGAGLQTAHRQGIVHQDIKPENIIITKENIAKIADFGLAKRIGQSIEGETPTIDGTLSYMSPEQLRGEPVDHSTDIWSLGVVLHEMVTGSLPFKGEYNEAIVYSILNERHAAISDIRKDVPRALEKIIDRCLEKKAADRFHDVDEVIRELSDVEYDAPEPQKSSSKSIAVLPFADISTDKDSNYFAEGLTEEIITNLSKLRKLKVISRSSVMRYEGGKKTPQKAAVELNVQYLLEGSVRKHGNDLRITAQLIDAHQDAYLWAETYRGTLEDVFDIQEKVAARIVKALKVRLTPSERQTLTKRFTENTDAYQLYLQGRFFWNKRSEEGLKTAVKYFNLAIKKDASYALAWAGLADTYNLLGEFGFIPRRELYPKAKEAVNKALKIDKKLAEAHVSLASLLMLYDWDWKESEKEFKLGLKLNPNYATAHHWYAELLLFTGRTEQALEELSRAVDLDPVSQAILKDKGLGYYYDREYDKAIEIAKKTLELDPEYSAAHRLLSLSYQAKGIFDKAIAENEWWERLAGNRVESAISLAQLYAVSGSSEEARRIVAALTPDDLQTGNICRNIALVYTALGEINTAFEWLEKSFVQHEESLTTIKVDPKVDSLRPDPRFMVLLRKIGLG